MFNIPVAKITDEFKRTTENLPPGETLFVDECHPNGKGHTAIADVLARVILEGNTEFTQ